MIRLGRTLAVVFQLAFVLMPVMEGREERVLSAHVEAPRTAPHPGHHPDWCPALQMLSVHGLAQARAELPAFPVVATASAVLAAPRRPGVELARTNCSRAPPASL